jgi:hypothetical protein
MFDEPELWPCSVDGAALFDELERLIRDFVVCDEPAAIAVALWTTLTWFEEAAQVAPILSFRSPVMRCGKSTCLAVIGRIVKRRLLTSNTTTAALFRAIEKFQPTLIVDEADTFFAQNEELRGIINSGHTRDAAYTLRTVGEDLEPRTFSTWSFKAVAGIGKLAATLEDRSITIELQRKSKDEKVERLRHTNLQKFETLVRKLARFAADNMARFAQARPELPDTLNDRQQDNWDHLFALAGLAGGAWPGKVRRAALELCSAAEDDDTSREKLLADIFEVLKASNLIDENCNIEHPHDLQHAHAGRPKEVIGIASSVLVFKLVAMSDRPWCEITHGKPLTQNGLARKLKPFGIRPKTVGSGAASSKGYAVADLVAAFTRYCTHPAKTLINPSQINSVMITVA